MPVKSQTFAFDRVLPMLPFVLLAGTLGFLTLQDQQMVGLLAILATLGALVIFARPEIGILVFLASFFVTYGSALSGMGRLTPNNLLGLFFSVLLIIRAYQERNLAFLKERIVQLFIVLVLFLQLSSNILERGLGNPFPQLDLTGQMLHDLTSRFAFLLFFVNFIRTLRDIKLVVWTLVVVILLSGLSGALNAILGAGFGIGGYRAVADVGISAAQNANRLAFYCVLGIAIIWYYKQAVRSHVLSVLLTATIPLLAISALLTASRSGLLNLVVVLCLVMMEGRFSLKRQLNLIFSAGLVIFLASDFLSETHFERLGNMPFVSSSGAKGASSTDKRINTIIDGVKIVIDDPMTGTGIGNFRWVRLQRFSRAGPPHNSYLWAITEGGVPAAALYCLIFWLALRKLLEAEKKSLNPEVRLITRGVRTGLISFLFFSIFADFWLNIMGYILIGLAIVIGNLVQRESPANFAVRREPRAALP